MSPPSIVAGASTAARRAPPPREESPRPRRAHRAGPLARTEQDRALAPDEDRIEGIERVRVPGIVTRDHDLGSAVLEQEAEGLVLGCRGGPGRALHAIRARASARRPRGAAAARARARACRSSTPPRTGSSPPARSPGEDARRVRGRVDVLARDQAVLEGEDVDAVPLEHAARRVRRRAVHSLTTRPSRAYSRRP